MAKLKLSPPARRAKALEADGKLTEAEATLRRALRDTPKDAAACAQLIRLYNRKLKQAEKGAALLPRLLKLAPKVAISHELAAENNFMRRQYNVARQHADETVRLGPKSPNGLYVAATVYLHFDLYEAAIDCMRAALEIVPDHLPSRLLYARALRSAGNLAEAEAVCRDIFQVHPDSLTNLGIWSRTCRQTADDPIYLHIRDNLLPKLRPHKGRPLIRVLQILGKAEDDVGNHETAFEHYAEAKALQTPRHDPRINTRFVNTIIAGTSTADYFGATGHASESPVLIVGMPRTGSTLLEQILSNHPQIGGIGESSLLRDAAVKSGFHTNDGRALVEAIHRMSPRRATALAQEYLDQSQQQEPDAIRIVDKRLHNYELLGIFGKLFPRARVIGALRDPMDNCMSCYLQPLNKFHSYTQDLTSLGQYYTEFRRLLDHWKKVIPNPILDVSYEALVADTEGEARKIIDFLGLEWDPACLNFQSNTHRARTLSSWQVRQPIYQSSVKRWKRYEKFLDPLKAELASFYPEGFDGP